MLEALKKFANKMAAPLSALIARLRPMSRATKRATLEAVLRVAPTFKPSGLKPSGPGPLALKPAFRPSASKPPALKLELSRETKILIITLLGSAAFVIVAALTKNLGILANAVLLSTLVVAAPQFLFLYEKYKDLKIMEERFPNFLRDVIESLRSGMPLHRSIIISSSFDYGKLSGEVKKMANQLSWGLPLDKVLDQFANRAKHSKRLFTSIKIIREAHLSGGDVVSTIETVANNSNILEESEKERRTVLNQYVILMYAICFIFIGIVVSINKLMIPIFEVSSSTAIGEQAIGISNPCSTCGGFSCMVCNVFGVISGYIFSIEATSIASYYVALFFSMSIIQAIFSGLVAGQIGENSLTAGIKHSLILVAITFGSFYFLIYLGFLGM